MTLDWLRRLKRFFRAPATIVGGLLAIAVLGALGAALPQAGVATAAETAHLRAHGPFLSALVDGLALDHVFTSPAFLASLGVSTVSLCIVVVEQAGRLRSQWGLVLSEGHFRTAPFRQEFLRPARQESAPSTRIRTRGRLSLAGSPLFHAGLLCVILAGGLRALFGAEAVVDLIEGETLPASVEAWGVQWPGPLGRPFSLDAPLVLESIESSRYSAGDLLGLRIGFSIQRPGHEQRLELGVNEELRTRGGRIYLDAMHGPAALVEWVVPTFAPIRSAILLERKEAKAFGAYAHGPRRLLARIRAPEPASGMRPGAVEIRILDGSAAIGEGTLKPGEALAFGGGGSLRLHGLPYWVRLHGNHDPALGLAYLGFALALLGATLIFAVVKVDELVSVSLEGDAERVVVALRPGRFAPLFKDRFERLLREQGGQP